MIVLEFTEISFTAIRFSAEQPVGWWCGVRGTAESSQRRPRMRGAILGDAGIATIGCFPFFPRRIWFGATSSARTVIEIKVVGWRKLKADELERRYGFAVFPQLCNRIQRSTF